VGGTERGVATECLSGSSGVGLRLVDSGIASSIKLGSAVLVDFLMSVSVDLTMIGDEVC
jgi:hypothetical protein